MSQQPVKVVLFPNDDPVLRGIATYLPRQTNPKMVHVGLVEDADIILCISKTMAAEMQATYNGKKLVAIIRTGKNEKQLKSVPLKVEIFDAKMVVQELKRLAQILVDSSHGSESPEQTPAPTTPSTPTSGDQTLRILVVDSNPDSQQNAELVFYKHKVTTARGYESALALIHAERFDVVITEVELVRLDDDDDAGAPYGLAIAFVAARKGIEQIMIFSDLSNGFGENFGPGTMQLDRSTLKIVEANGIGLEKNWADALAEILN